MHRRNANRTVSWAARIRRPSHSKRPDFISFCVMGSRPPCKTLDQLPPTSQPSLPPYQPFSDQTKQTLVQQLDGHLGVMLGDPSSSPPTNTTMLDVIDEEPEAPVRPKRFTKERSGQSVVSSYAEKFVGRLSKKVWNRAGEGEEGRSERSLERGLPQMSTRTEFIRLEQSLYELDSQQINQLRSQKHNLNNKHLLHLHRNSIRTSRLPQPPLPNKLSTVHHHCDYTYGYQGQKLQLKSTTRHKHQSSLHSMKYNVFQQSVEMVPKLELVERCGTLKETKGNQREIEAVVLETFRERLRRAIEESRGLRSVMPGGGEQRGKVCRG